MKKKYLPLVLGLGLLGLLAGCGKKEEAVVFVEEAAEEDTVLPKEEPVEGEGKGAAEPGLPKELPEPGTVLGEEEMLLYLDGEEQTLLLRRVQGSFGYSLAFEGDTYALVAGEVEDVVVLAEALPAAQVQEGQETAGEAGAEAQGGGPVYMTISENLDYALEELADELVLTCDVECLVEEITIGEEEYPAIWISYMREENGEAYQVDTYLVGFETHVFQIEMECPEQELGSRGDVQQIILSTLRFDSIAEG